MNTGEEEIASHKEGSVCSPIRKDFFRAEDKRDPTCVHRRLSVVSRVFGGLLVAAAIFAAQPASATTIIAKDFAALCAEADLIFVGTVRAVVSRWTDPEQRAIETLVTFSDVTPVFGTEGREVTLRFGGGQVGTLREEIAGVPQFAVGDRRVIFARREYSVSPIVGFHQGVFPVVDTPQGPVVAGVEAAAPEEGASTEAPRASREGAVPLDTFLDRVRRELASRPDRGR